MRLPKFILCALLLSSAGIPLTAQPSPVQSSPAKSSPATVRFPAITAYSLTKAKVTLPAALTGNRNLLLLSFDADQTPEINRWVTEVQSLSRLHNDLSYYLLPVSEQRNPLFRWWDNSSMRSDFSDPQLWPRVVPLYLNEKQFREELQIPTGHEVVILLTDRAGNVLWRTSGPMDPQKIAALQAILQSS